MFAVLRRTRLSGAHVAVQSPLPPANPPSPFANGVSPLSPPLALMPLLVGSVPLRIQSPVRETDFSLPLSSNSLSRFRDSV